LLGLIGLYSAITSIPGGFQVARNGLVFAPSKLIDTENSRCLP